MEMRDNRLYRSCTMDEDVQGLLLKYLKNDDYEQLKDLLEEGRVDVNFIYNDLEEFLFQDITALQIACGYYAQETSTKCIQLLLDYGADITFEDGQQSTIHYAAQSGNPDILKTILQYSHKNEIDLSNCNVIYDFIRFVQDSGQEDSNHDGGSNYTQILELLLDADLDINLQDAESGWTAIYAATKYGMRDFISVIIKKKFSEVNLDEFKDSRGKSARDLILEKQLYLEDLPPFKEENCNMTIYTLYKNLREKKVSEFRTNYGSFKTNISAEDQYSLLHMAVDKRLDEAVKFLLNEGADYTIHYIGMDKDNPLELACKRGYYKIVKLLLNKKPPDPKLVSKALVELLKSIAQDETDDVNYNRCLELLLKCRNLDINAQDWNKNSALHYAIRYQNPEMVLQILRKGASLANKDSFNRLAVADIDYETLEAHFNECIRYESEELSTADDACLVINVTTLVPPRSPSKSCHETSVKVDLHPEEPLKTLEESAEAPEEEATLLLPETEVLEYMCTSQELKPLLKHPVILAFLYLKWYRIRMFFYINLAVYLLFVISLLTYITVGYTKKSEMQYEFLAWVSYLLLTVTFVLLILRELFQVIIFKYRYFLTFENWLELILLTVTAGILIEQSNETIMRQLSAVAIVASAIEFLLLIGQFPSMSTNIMMLRTVSFTFFKLLLWYSILLLAFAYSFYTLFQETEPEAPTNSTSTDDDEEQDFFEDPGMSLLKTIVMLTGEFDAASIKFNTYPIISHIIFVMFVFLIAIVLFNLLNGLAVSDTQIIKKDAELYGQILRVEHIAHVERVLLTNKKIQWLPVIRRICLFPLNVAKTEILIYPNKNSKVSLMETLSDDQETDGPQTCYKQYFDVYLDKKVQRAIRSLMKDIKDNESKRKKEENILKEVAQLRQLIQSLIDKK